MDSRRVIARFEAERQALALMDHPGIARVYDAGAGADGRPWFAMEYVRGEPLTDYCARHRLPPRERVALLAAVCDAVHHAHQRGVIHRDLKPTNLLVQVEGDNPVVKVIDFGVAKAMGPELADGLHTELGQLLGTPEYMSPEQAEMTGLNVDTRTDIWSLGVVLYELLTGTLPVPTEAVRGRGVGEIHRVLRETETPRPSTASPRGRTTTAALARQLRGDLDWITLKALEKDRTRRYASASELAEDLRRHLRDEPVLAGPPGARYRAGKFVRRHRTGVAVGAVLAAALVAGVIATGWQAARAVRAERASREQAAVAGAVNEFLTGMLAQASPETNPLGREASIGEVLDAAAARLPGAFPDQPAVEAAVRRTVGEAYGTLARYDDARAHLEAALALYRRMGDGERTAATLGNVVTLELAAARPEEAERAAEEELAVARGAAGGGPAALAAAVLDQARTASARGRFTEADSLYGAALELHERAEAAAAAAPAADPERRAEILGGHAAVLQQQGRFEETEALLRRAHGTLEESLGASHPSTLRALLSLARLLEETGRFADAEAANRTALEESRRVFGDAHPTTADALLGVGMTVARQGRTEEAEPLLRGAIAIERRVHGDAGGPVAVGLSHLGAMLLEADRTEEAEAAFREALAINRATDDAPETFRNANNLAAALRRMGRLAQAEAMFREAATVGAAIFGEESVQVAQVRHNLAKTLSDAGRYAEAGPEFEAAIALAERAFPVDHVTLDIMRGNRGEMLLRAGRPAEAGPVLSAAYEAIAGKLGEDHPRAKVVEGWLAELREATGRSGE
jgi:tetratricopeptide (TPR) repeat protein